MPSVLPVLHFTYSCNDESINQLDKSKKHYSIQQYFFFFQAKHFYRIFICQNALL